ncbi:hypothetical protein ACHQM5_004840 [Ranunculus cassubicifolius]
MEEKNYTKLYTKLDEFDVSRVSFQQVEQIHDGSDSHSVLVGSLMEEGVSGASVDKQIGESSCLKQCDGVREESGDENDEQRYLDDDDDELVVKVILRVEYVRSDTQRGGKDLRGESDRQIGEEDLRGECDVSLRQDSFGEDIESKNLDDANQKNGRYFYYESPLWEETGVWIPVSLPPMSASDHDDWTKGFCTNGGYFPDGEMGWSQYAGEEKELTMWDVVLEMLLAARGKAQAIASGDVQGLMISWVASNNLLEQAWKDVASTLSQVSEGNTKEILETEPPKWLSDSASAMCMLCNVRFHPIMCSRHHCRFCGGLFCSECTKGRSLLPEKFRTADPQRVCDVCCVRLESVQSYLMDHVSRASQLPTHDLTDLSTLRSWANFPWGQSMEYEIYKAANTVRGYSKVGSLKAERSIPEKILSQAKGLAILTVAKVGAVVTYKIGTGIVIARKEDGSWSAPSAISSFGLGWGAQVGGELTDFIVVLRTEEAVKTFSGNVHMSVGAGASAAAGIVGRVVEADLRAGDGGYAACYTYSCSKGAFVGCSLEGSIVTTRTLENARFYGSPSISASDILLGTLPRPPAAASLYNALADLFKKF